VFLAKKAVKIALGPSVSRVLLAISKLLPLGVYQDVQKVNT
jgi:hypothetical protein